ncbi:alginate regulatory protein AlgP [Minicystis rosea]|nr:alginate regulatory protein AlgP [Minicystis rosea]
MSKDEETTDKPTEQPTDATAAPRQRKIVRRSASTRDNPAFSEEAPAAEGEASQADAPKAAEGAPTSGAPGHRRFDARAPRPANPGAGQARPPRRDRPARPGGGGDRPARPGGGGDYRPPPARPAGARPIPGGSRAPASGDFRPPPARPAGARPIPGGSRAPASGEQHEERRERRPRPEGGRPPFAGEAAQAKPAASSKPAAQAKPPVPAPVPSKPAAPPPAPKAAAPKPVFIPLARAGQVAQSAKPALTPKEALAAKTKAYAAKSTPKPAQKAAEATATTFDAALASASAEEAVAALAQAGDAATALVDAWLAASNAAALVEASESEAAPSSARKAAKRALNVLRSRGVTIPTRSRVVKLDERVEVSIEAQLIPPDTSGTMAVSITSKDASGRYHIAEVLIREPVGIIQAGSGWLSGTQIKEGRTRALEGLGVAPVPVPVEWARHRIANARKLNATSGQILPLGLEGCRELIEPAPEAVPAHPLADLEAALDTARAADVVPSSGSLHNEPEFRSWLPDRGTLDELLQKVGERLGSAGAGDPEAVGVALREETDAATDRFFSPEVRNIVTARMRDAAISVRARKGDGRANDVLQVAHAVKEAGLITSPPREIPFLVAFFQKALGLLAQQGGGQLRVPVAAGGAAPTE